MTADIRPTVITCGDIADAIATAAPLSIQESWDNSGVQLGDMSAPCTGVLLALDPTEAAIDEAVARGCNLVVTHHPLLFKGLKHITGANAVERAVIKAIKAGVAVYSSHTAMDSAVGGVSAEMARRLGARVVRPLAPDAPGSDTGLGVVADFDTPVSGSELVRRVHQAFGSHPLRCSAIPSGTFSRIALCGGSGGEFIADAIAAGAAAYVTAEIRYHDMLDRGKDIFLLDIGHFESETCAKDIFYRIITEKFPNFAVKYSQTEENPINYL